MAVVNGCSLSIFAHSVCAMALLGLASAGVPAVVKATPITFSFDAMITDISDPDRVAASLSFTPTIGQPISGLVTFTPVLFSETTGPDASLEILLGGEHFGAQALQLVTSNDVFIAFGVHVRGPNDGVSIACSELNGCAMPTSSLTGFETAYLGIGLSSRDADLIQYGENLGSPEIWNRLPFRRLTVQLAPSSDDKQLTIGADVGPMRLVPEPTSAMDLFLIVALLSGLVRSCRN